MGRSSSFLSIFFPDVQRKAGLVLDHTLMEDIKEELRILQKEIGGGTTKHQTSIYTACIV